MISWVEGFKECPFCGCEELSVTKRCVFERFVESTGSFCVSVSCDSCSAEVYAHNETDYDKAINDLRIKWNKRGGNNDD